MCEFFKKENSIKFKKEISQLVQLSSVLKKLHLAMREFLSQKNVLGNNGKNAENSMYSTIKKKIIIIIPV